MVLELKIFKLSLYRCYLPLKKKRVLHWTKMNFLYPRLPCYKCSSNWPSRSVEEDENVKSLRQQRWQQQQCTMDKLWSEKLTWAFDSGELKCFCMIFVYFQSFNYTDWQNGLNSQCSKQSMYYQIRLHFQQHVWSSSSSFSSFSSSFFQTPPVNIMNKVVSMQCSWDNCVAFSSFSFEIFSNKCTPSCT